MRFSSVFGDLFGRKSVPQKSGRISAESPSVPMSASEQARQEKLRQSAESHHGILNEDFARMLERADEGYRFPESSDEPLAYLGNLEPLGLSSEERRVVREWTSELIEEKGERAVWNSRLRLKLELRYLAMESGLQKSTGRTPREAK